VEPNFPIPPKSKNHKNFLPIGLLKIGAYLKDNGNEVRLERGVFWDNPEKQKDLMEFNPGEIWVTSLFTYWSEYVKDSVDFYRKLFPSANIKVGGIYASLMPEHCKNYTGCDEVQEGVFDEAEEYFPDYSLLPQNGEAIDYQIIHASRGCIRKCQFCGTWKIEPDFKPKKSIRNEIKYRKIVFYDNNLLANPYVEEILSELALLKKEKKILWCESQSGFDGRLLLKKAYLAEMLKKAGFRNLRIAWDGKIEEFKKVKEQISILTGAGYISKDIYVFMIYNWRISFEDMERKRIECLKWKVQIADCRYRPLDQTFDDYNPRLKHQMSADYFIMEEAGWSDSLVRQFRKNVRRQNICIRHNFPFYSKALEQKRVRKEVVSLIEQFKTRKEIENHLQMLGIDYWYPDEITYPNKQEKFKKPQSRESNRESKTQLVSA